VRNKLSAKKLNVYAVPFVNPLTVTGDEAADPVKHPGLDFAVYEVIAPPPTHDGAVNVTDADALAPVAVPIVGAFGTFSGL